MQNWLIQPQAPHQVTIPQAPTLPHQEPDPLEERQPRQLQEEVSLLKSKVSLHFNHQAMHLFDD